MISALTRALTAAMLAVAGVGAASCRDIPGSEGGVVAVGKVRLPSPGLVVGDTMRDSLGNVSPLRVVAFDRGGDTIRPDPEASFFLLDTTARLAGALLVGRSAGTARVVAVVAGLQTQPEAVTVTLSPDTLVAADSLRHVRRVNLLSGDTSFASADLNAIVQHREAATVSGVDAVIVTYTLTRIPASGAAGPAVMFVGGGTTPARDTTSNGGRAGRAVRLRVPAQPRLPDSAVVTATASYRGRSLGSLQFTVVFQTQ